MRTLSLGKYKLSIVSFFSNLSVNDDKLEDSGEVFHNFSKVGLDPNEMTSVWDGKLGNSGLRIIGVSSWTAKYYSQGPALNLMGALSCITLQLDWLVSKVTLVERF